MPDLRDQGQAQVWVRELEAEIDKGGMLPQLGTTTVGEVIEAYRELRERGRPIKDTSTEHYTLKTLQRGLGDKRLGGDETWMVTSRDPNGVFIELHQYDERSMQQHGGICVIDYTPRPRAT